MKFNTQSGLASRTIIILAVAVLIIGAAAYGITRLVAGRKLSFSKDSSTVVEPPKPVYDVTVGETRFVFELAKNNGKILFGKSSNFPKYQTDITTTEKFITVIVRAQNKGETDTARYNWDLGNIIDSSGRNFTPINEKAYSWLPQPDLCGAVLKPEFDPVPCVRIYEVSSVSENLKLEVMALKADSSKMQKDLIDLKVTR